MLKNDRIVQSYLKQGIPAKYKKVHKQVLLISTFAENRNRKTIFDSTRKKTVHMYTVQSGRNRGQIVTTEWSGAADAICQDGTAHNGIKIKRKLSSPNKLYFTKHRFQAFNV